MPEKEGELLRNKFLGTGKKIPAIAKLLGMTRQNLNIHLKKETLGDDFKRLVKEKEKAIFQTEYQDKKKKPGNLMAGVVQDLIYLKASDKMQGELLSRIAAKVFKTTPEFEAEELEKNVSREADRLYDEYEN